MNNPLYDVIGDNKPYRLADKAGVPRNTAYKYLQRELPKRVDLRVLARLAKVLGREVKITCE